MNAQQGGTGGSVCVMNISAFLPSARFIESDPITMYLHGFPAHVPADYDILPFARQLQGAHPRIRAAVRADL